ncbi:MAG: PepSY-associated TM helix domain-containing protein [Chitinophagaceae bacterium]
MKNNYSFRKFINDVHLWLGIGSGLILFIVCLSGTIYTFRPEIERATSSSKYYAKIPAGSARLSPQQLVDRLENQFRGKVTSILIPSDAALNYQVSIKPGGGEDAAMVSKKTNILQKDPGGKEQVIGKPGVAGVGENEKKEEARPTTYFVNPYTAAVAGEQGGGSTRFFATVMQLHRWLLMDRSTGTVIVGIATIIFVLVILSGLVIWLPRRIRNLKQGLTIKFSSNWKRINHDLHNVLGFYTMPLLLIMALTGLCWSFEWYKNGLSNVLGAKVFRGRNEKPMQSLAGSENAATVSLNVLLASTDKLFSYPGDVRVAFPADELGSISVSKNKTGFLAFPGADKIEFDRFTGRELKTEYFSNKPLNQKIADSIKPLHTGEIYGLFSKILYFIACLVATTLPVTGTIIWINKLRKKARVTSSARQRQAASVPV